jgi:hypothetical protein
MPSKTVLSVAVVSLVLSACMKKASWMPNDHGGYTMMAEDRSVERALNRFRYTADEVCQGRRYTMTSPVVTDRGWSFRAGGGVARGGTVVNVQTDVVCQ